MEPANANANEDEMISIIPSSATAPQLKSLAKTVLSGDPNVPKARVLIHDLVDEGLICTAFLALKYLFHVWVRI